MRVGHSGTAQVPVGWESSVVNQIWALACKSCLIKSNARREACARAKKKGNHCGNIVGGACDLEKKKKVDENDNDAETI